MPVKEITPVDRRFVRGVNVPDVRGLAAMLEDRGRLMGQQALNRGQGSAATWMGLAQAFGAYQDAVQQRNREAMLMEQRAQERQAAEQLKRDEMTMRSAERQQEAARFARTDERLGRTESRQAAAEELAASDRLANNTVPGVVPSAMAERLKPSGRMQVLDGAPVLMRTPAQARQAEMDAQTQADRTADNQRMTAAQKEAERHNRVMESRESSVGNTPVVVQTPEGPAVLDRRTLTAQPITMGGKPVGVTPSANERMDSRKFSKSAPVLRGIGELSERINTLQGVYAKAAGEAERQKAKINLNDDVAEYESLISGFTPMIARALGHTGVLTEQDVQSVKALFPRPGDSKTLRDRKVNRMMGIIGELEGVEGVSNVAPNASPAPRRGGNPFAPK